MSSLFCQLTPFFTRQIPVIIIIIVVIALVLLGQQLQTRIE